MAKPEKTWLKEAAIQIGSGGSAGFVEVCIMHPMDLVKTRLQIQVKSTQADPNYYTGFVKILPKLWNSIIDFENYRNFRLLEKNVPKRRLAGLLERNFASNTGRNSKTSSKSTKYSFIFEKKFADKFFFCKCSSLHSSNISSSFFLDLINLPQL